jgi:hypothetical protein
LSAPGTLSVPGDAIALMSDEDANEQPRLLMFVDKLQRSATGSSMEQ